MKGVKRFVVKARNVTYDITLKRNVTYVIGDSATGKTYLCSLLQKYNKNPVSSGISVDASCKVETIYDEKEWEHNITHSVNTIFVLDEDVSFVETERFAEIVKHSSNYFLLFQRKPLVTIPCAISEVYELTGSKLNKLKPVYHVKDNRLWGTLNNTIDKLVTEDSGSGHTFFKHSIKGCEEYVPAGGNGNIAKYCSGDKRILVIADGAAIGPQAANLYAILQVNPDLCVYLPESFEWLLLQTNRFKDQQLTEILRNPIDFVESSEYLTWERFFTQLLLDRTQNKYSKGTLGREYLQKQFIQEVMNLTPISGVHGSQKSNVSDPMSMLVERFGDAAQDEAQKLISCVTPAVAKLNDLQTDEDKLVYMMKQEGYL